MILGGRPLSAVTRHVTRRPHPSTIKDVSGRSTNSRPAHRSHVAQAALQGLWRRCVVPVSYRFRNVQDGGLRSCNSAVIDIDAVPQGLAHVVDEGSLHCQTLSAAGIGIDLELERLDRPARRSLVIDDDEVLRAGLVAVINDVGPAADDDAGQVELERTLGCPSLAQIVLMVVDVLEDQLPGVLAHLLVGRLVCER